MVKVGVPDKASPISRSWAKSIFTFFFSFGVLTINSFAFFDMTTQAVFLPLLFLPAWRQAAHHAVWFAVPWFSPDARSADSGRRPRRQAARSEEHTSELQS